MSYAAALDDLPKGAWIAIMIVGFIIFWPVGLGILAFLIWSGKMGSWKNERHACGNWSKRHRHGYRRSSGNSAFDDYRDETLKRLEEEQREFSEFVDQLRRAKDRQQFEEFMAARKGGSTPQPDAQA